MICYQLPCFTGPCFINPASADLGTALGATVGEPHAQAGPMVVGLPPEADNSSSFQLGHPDMPTCGRLAPNSKP